MLVSPALLVCLVSTAQAPDPTVFTLKNRAFRVPVQVESRRQDIEQILLYVSIDKGKTWTETAVIGPDEEWFRCIVPADGSYWFAVQVALKNKTKEPAETRLLQPALKVEVQTPKKPDGKGPLGEPDDDLRQLRAEVKRLTERVTALEKRLKEKP